MVIAEYGSQDVICPFYKEDTRKTIKCEGAFSVGCTHGFNAPTEKRKHKEFYCDTFKYKNCPHYIQVLSMYKPNLKETAGTFSKDTLLKYKQK